MNYNFENYLREPIEQPQYPNPCDYICEDRDRIFKARGSLDSIARSEEIPTTFALHENHDIKKIIGTSSHEVMFSTDELVFCEDLKFELSEK